MACNSYQTYHSRKSCGGYPACNRWDRIYFPDFVANSCCNPCCESSNDTAADHGCSICNGGGYGFCDHGYDHGYDHGNTCGCHSGTSCSGCGKTSCGRGCNGFCGYDGWGCSCRNHDWGCCGYCPCGCQDWWGCRNGICPR